MADYDFSTLNSSDFEELTCDLLNADEKQKHSLIRFKTFKDGKDRGIDLLYSTQENEFEMVGQVKHYYRSGYGAMLNLLKNDEVKKVKLLNPNKYLFITSVDLGPDDSLEIKKLFSPFITSLSDIYGKKDVNKLLESYSEVLNNHFKLWYSSTTVLQKIINYQIEGRSNEFKEKQLKKKLRLYVKNDLIGNARQLLSKNNFIVITGEPGAGKTTTAELLLYEYIKDGYELIYIYDDIKEAEKKITNDNKKQIFYFDDFLGHNSLEIARAKGSETALLKILVRLSDSINKKFIFTTRTFILNASIEESEKLRRFNFRAKESCIKLDAYTNSIKRQILANHVEESEISEALKEVLTDKKIIDFIVGHDNFSPRSVEYITSIQNVGDFNRDDFRKFILEKFNYPDEIWRHAYEQQISDYDRMLLNTMVSFSDYVHIFDLEVAFNSRLNYEVKNNNFERPLNAFKMSFKILLNGFITETSDNSNLYKFINPSLVDFLVKYLQSNLDEVVRISESIISIDQLTAKLFPIGKNPSEGLKSKISKSLKSRILNSHSGLIKPGNENHDKLILAMWIHNYIDLNDSEKIICDLIEPINDWKFIEEDHDICFYLINFLENISSVAVLKVIGSKAKQMLIQMLFMENDIMEVLKLLKLFENNLKIKIDNYLHEEIYSELEEHLNNLVNEKIENDIESLLEYSYAQDFVNEMEKESIEIESHLKRLGLEIHANLSQYSCYDWYDIGMQNYFNEQMNKDD